MITSTVAMQWGHSRADCCAGRSCSSCKRNRTAANSRAAPGSKPTPATSLAWPKPLPKPPAPLWPPGYFFSVHPSPFSDHFRQYLFRYRSFLWVIMNSRFEENENSLTSFRVILLDVLLFSCFSVSLSVQSSQLLVFFLFARKKVLQSFHFQCLLLELQNESFNLARLLLRKKIMYTKLTIYWGSIRVFFVILWQIGSSTEPQLSGTTRFYRQRFGQLLECFHFHKSVWCFSL